MKPAAIFSFLLLVLTSTSHARSPPNLQLINPIRLFSDHLQRVSGRPWTWPLQDQDDDGGSNYPVWECSSWRLVVETDSLRNWKVIPRACVDYVKDYMSTEILSFDFAYSQYWFDLMQLVTSIGNYFNLEFPNKTDKDIIIFDLSETLLSNLPYYERPDVYYGSKPFNSTSFLEWVKQGDAPAVPIMTSVYQSLISVEYKVVILTGSSEALRGVLEANLKKAGYDSWFKFILKDEAISTRKFKAKVRTQLVEEGYKIVANIGDQWRDITGAHAGAHTFKVPNPMYYLA